MNAIPDIQCGALKSPEDPNDHIFERLARGYDGIWTEIPDTFTLQKHSQPPRDQGNRGTCSAFAASSIKEIQESRDCGFNEWMSPEFIYYHRENKPAHGMYGRNVFQILKQIGSVPEDAYPYNYEQKPDNEHYQIAAQYKITNYAKVTTVEGLKRALIEIGPCYLQLPLYRTRPEFWRPELNERAIGGHALAVVGYDMEGFILQNSWGPNWNNDGTIMFPYSDWNIIWECWVSIDEKTHVPTKRYSGSYVIKHEHYHIYKKTGTSDPSLTTDTSTEKPKTKLRPKSEPSRRKKDSCTIS